MRVAVPGVSAGPQITRARERAGRGYPTGGVDRSELRLLAAARLGKARLIDNLGVTVDHGTHR